MPIPVPTIAAVNCRSKTGTLNLPSILPAAMPGTLPLGFDKARGCQSWEGYQPNFHWVASTTGTSADGVSFTINWDVSYNQVSDNSDGTWQYTFLASATIDGGLSIGSFVGSSPSGSVTPGGACFFKYAYFFPVTEISAVVTDPSTGDTETVVANPTDLTFLTPGCPYFYGDFSVLFTDSTLSKALNFTGYEGLILSGVTNVESTYVSLFLDKDNARYDLPANCVTMFLTRAAAGTFEVSYALLEWQVVVSGLTPGTSYSIYLHLDQRYYATPPWVSGAYTIEVDFIASAETVTLPWVGKEFFAQNMPFAQSGGIWPGLLPEFQLNSVDFTPPTCCCCCCCPPPCCCCCC